MKTASAIRGRTSASRELVSESLHDLAADLAEAGWIARSTCARLDGALGELDDARRHFHAATLRTTADELVSLRRRFGILRDHLLTMRETALAARPTESLLDRLTEERRDYAELLRALQSMAAAAITATDWQSPSFGHSVRSQAGRFSGRVTEHHDDYRRDRHHDAARFEEEYLLEYVDHPPGMRLRALMTSCGMSAFTTVLAYLTMEGRQPAGVLVGRSLYHECRDLVARSPLGPGAVHVEEESAEALVAALERHRPGAVFLDTLCNEKSIGLPDLRTVIGRLAPDGRPVTLVVDNTGLSCSFQPFALLPKEAGSVRLIVIESLTKYPQFGLDRTPAGMIVAEERDAARLSEYREHLGTNVADASPYLIPVPSRTALERRLARLGRNAEELARHLQQHAEEAEGPVAGACHPGLPGHPSFETARTLPFRGGYFAVRFRPEDDRVEVHRRFLSTVLEEAGRRGVPVVAGASFGFDISRVYVTASDDVFGPPFVRVAAGMEHRLALEALKETLAAAADRL